MEELKACPHCGGEAEFVRKPIKTKGTWCDAVYVRCKKCDARTNRVLYNAKSHPNDEEYQQAANAWNRRAEPENKALTLEQLQQMDGEQVWIPETEAYFSGHGIVNVKEEKVYASDEENDYYPFDEYGAWLAYARKPEGSEKP